MRKLKLQVQMSVDGYIADVNGKADWMIWNWSPEWTWDDALRKYFIDLKQSVDCVLLSRKMAVEGFIGHWARVAENPNDPQAAFARKITSARKIVFTKTLDESAPAAYGWNNTAIANGDLVSEINKLKSQEGKDIIVYGGASFVSSLIKAGLIDEYHLFINPTVLGDGMPIFEELDSKLNLTFVDARPYDCGVTVLNYRQKTPK
jgi:dihydrofolate reductase